MLIEPSHLGNYSRQLVFVFSAGRFRNRHCWILSWIGISLVIWLVWPVDLPINGDSIGQYGLTSSGCCSNLPACSSFASVASFTDCFAKFFVCISLAIALFSGFAGLIGGGSTELILFTSRNWCSNLQVW